MFGRHYGEDCNPPPPPIHHGPWKNMKKHMACVPKGFLRFRVLQLLKEKPMSGSEIMDAIEKETHGFWKPSPGSIYPLLAWLQDKGYIKEVLGIESGMRRYTVTEQGLKLLEEQSKIREKMRKMALFAPHLIWFPPPVGRRVDESQESLERLIKAFIDLREVLEERFSEQVVKETTEILNDAAEKIEALVKKIKGERR